MDFVILTVSGRFPRLTAISLPARLSSRAARSALWEETLHSFSTFQIPAPSVRYDPKPLSQRMLPPDAVGTLNCVTS